MTKKDTAVENSESLMASGVGFVGLAWTVGLTNRLTLSIKNESVDCQKISMEGWEALRQKVKNNTCIYNINILVTKTAFS